MITIEKIDACIWANELAHVDSVSRFRLNGLSDRLRRYRCTLSKLLPDEAALYAGDNWHGPAIADLISESEEIRTPAKILPLPFVTTKVRHLDADLWPDLEVSNG
jgi:hypothetical protein